MTFMHDRYPARALSASHRSLVRMRPLFERALDAQWLSFRQAMALLAICSTKLKDSAHSKRHRAEALAYRRM